MTTPGKTIRREPENNTSLISTGKKSKDHYQHACPICEHEITEAQDESEPGEDVNEGDDAVFCKGLCQNGFTVHVVVLHVSCLLPWVSQMNPLCVIIV